MSKMKDHAIDMMNREDRYRHLELDGVSMTIKQWSLKTGLGTSCIGTRLANGWDVRRVLTTPSKPTRTGNGKMNKNEAELMLNDTPKDNLPKELLKLITNKYDGTKYGQYIRRNFPKEFDRFYAIHCAGRPSPA